MSPIIGMVLVNVSLVGKEYSKSIFEILLLLKYVERTSIELNYDFCLVNDTAVFQTLECALALHTRMLSLKD